MLLSRFNKFLRPRAHLRRPRGFRLKAPAAAPEPMGSDGRRMQPAGRCADRRMPTVRNSDSGQAGRECSVQHLPSLPLLPWVGLGWGTADQEATFRKRVEGPLLLLELARGFRVSPGRLGKALNRPLSGSVVRSLLVGGTVIMHEDAWQNCSGIQAMKWAALIAFETPASHEQAFQIPSARRGLRKPIFFEFPVGQARIPP